MSQQNYDVYSKKFSKEDKGEENEIFRHTASLLMFNNKNNNNINNNSDYYKNKESGKNSFLKEEGFTEKNLLNSKSSTIAIHDENERNEKKKLKNF